ncbi:hypothetical protein F4777DRAFT_528843 [Nemania sp. FL0916]|nr:hypothetical protein F4777DRAFT_528843 [Nemania sp. FL0916]
MPLYLRPWCEFVHDYPLRTALGRIGASPILDDRGEGVIEGSGEDDSKDGSSAELRDEGHDFSLIGSAKRLGAMRRAMLVQYRAMTSVRARNPRTETMLGTIAVMRVVSKPAIVSSVLGLVGDNLVCLLIKSLSRCDDLRAEPKSNYDERLDSVAITSAAILSTVTRATMVARMKTDDWCFLPTVLMFKGNRENLLTQSFET